MTHQRTFTEHNMDHATAIAKVDTEPQAVSPMALLQQAISQNMEPAHMLHLTELCERWQKNIAAEEFGRALTKFQELCPRVNKVREATIHSQKGSNYKYQFASFDDVMAKASPALKECGLAISFSTTAIDKGIRVTCRVRHGIHAEDHTLDVPVPAMNVNDTQRYGAALSYAKRYALCAALNIVVTDDVDDDAMSLNDGISIEQETEILELLERKGDQHRKPLLEWAGVSTVDKIPASKFAQAVRTLRGKPDASR